MSVYISQHGYYSRTVVLRLLEGKYKSLVSDSLRNQYHCVAPLYFRGVNLEVKRKQTSMRCLMQVAELTA